MSRIWRWLTGKSTRPRRKSRTCNGRFFGPKHGRMSSLVQVAIHASQFPEKVRRDLLESLRTRRVNHKFHYDSVKQTQKWLALHQAYSPSRTDADCAATYDRSFAAVAERIEAGRVHLIGLGCGGGQKDTRLLKLLRDSGRKRATRRRMSAQRWCWRRARRRWPWCPGRNALRWCVIWALRMIWEGDRGVGGDTGAGGTPALRWGAA